MQLFGLGALFLSVVWMLRNENDKSRPILVLALVFNLVYFWIVGVVLRREDAWLAWKFDYFLVNLDLSLGASAASIARPLQGIWRIPLVVVYNLMVPMMICWFPLTRGQNRRGALILAYATELVFAPMMYSLLPACGPVYAFGSKWLSTVAAPAHLIRLSGMPNAFPSLHIATAIVLVVSARGKLWRAIALVFLAATALATMATGEHYVIDLIPGLAFGSFAASVGLRRMRTALLYFGITLFWSLAVRFEYAVLVVHPVLLRSVAAATIAPVALAVHRAWRAEALKGRDTAEPKPLHPVTVA